MLVFMYVSVFRNVPHRECRTPVVVFSKFVIAAVVVVMVALAAVVPVKIAAFVCGSSGRLQRPLERVVTEVFLLRLLVTTRRR